MVGSIADFTRRHFYGRYEHCCSRPGSVEPPRGLQGGGRDARSYRRQVDRDGGRRLIERTDPLQRDPAPRRRDIAAHAHADPERPGAGRVGHPHDVSNDSAPRGLRVDQARAQVDRAVASALSVGAGKPAGDAGRTGGVSEKGTARLAAPALYRPEIGLVLAANDMNPALRGSVARTAGYGPARPPENSRSRLAAHGREPMIHTIRRLIDRKPFRCIDGIYLGLLDAGSKALSAGPPGPSEILPGTAIYVALRIQGLRTRVFRGVELKNHPLRIWNARIRRRVQKPDFFVREPKVYGTDVILQLLSLPGSDDHTADGRPSQHPRQRRTGRACVVATRPLLQRL